MIMNPMQDISIRFMTLKLFAIFSINPVENIKFFERRHKKSKIIPAKKYKIIKIWNILFLRTFLLEMAM